MIPILTPLVLGLVGYEYFKYSRSNEQIGILVNKVAYSNFRTIVDIQKKFGSSESAILLESIYDSLILRDSSLVPNHYHHINRLKLFALIPAAIIDYDPKGVFEAIAENYCVTAVYNGLADTVNDIKARYRHNIFSTQPEPTKPEDKPTEYRSTGWQDHWRYGSDEYHNLGKSGVSK